MPAEYISLPELTLRLRAAAERTGAPAPTYAQITGRVRNGDIRAVKRAKEWRVATVDVPAAAAVFGLTVPAAEDQRHARAA